MLRTSGRAGTILALLLMAGSARAALVISGKPTHNVSCAAGVCSATAKNAVLNVSDLAGQLATSDVQVASGATAQDIVLDRTLKWSSTQHLTLDSHRAITFNAPLEVNGAGALTITVNDGNAAGPIQGDFVFRGGGHVAFKNTDNALTINGAQYLLFRNLKTLAHYAKRHGGHFALSQSYDASRDGTYAHAVLPGVSGTFEGLGNTISNLSIDSTDHEVAFIGEAGTYNGYIRDVSLTSVNIHGSGTTGQEVAALVAYDDTVANGNVFSISNCSATGVVTADAPNSFAGGLVGLVYGFVVVYQSHADVTVTAAAGSDVGGLIGYDGDGYIAQSYATGVVTGGDGATVGGLVGWHWCFDWPHGLFDVYATGAVAGGNDAFVGGLVGQQQTETGDGDGQAFVKRGYATGAVGAGTGSVVGGLVGKDTQAPVFIFNSYWDMDTTGITDPSKGAGSPANDPGITGLSDVALKSGLPAGFPPVVWAQSATVNNGYPYFPASALIQLP